MEIRTKKQILTKLNKISELHIEQGLYYKDLAHSLKQHYKNKTLKEWKEILKGRLE